ncbi:unnamed protein product [Nezara viridula]|uniref:Uncharacterized protein n=1 Tax=Nezara viridula TaxID=85310 RepID=A0A9P0E517_NEZVI|nr:unnamed protein product [Nezara viridula]
MRYTIFQTDTILKRSGTTRTEDRAQEQVGGAAKWIPWSATVRELLRSPSLNAALPVADTGDEETPTDAVSTGEWIEGRPLTDQTDNQSPGLPEIFLRLMYMPSGTMGIISQSFHSHLTMLAQSSLANTLAFCLLKQPLPNVYPGSLKPGQLPSLRSQCNTNQLILTIG